jgi:hypothetical protein
MFTALLSWLTGGGIAAIGKQLNAAYQAKLAAKNATEALQADMDIAQLSARQAVLIAEQGSWMTRWIRPAFAAPFVVYIWKVVVWDMVLGWGVTRPLGDQMNWVLVTMVGAFFLARPFEKSR